MKIKKLTTIALVLLIAFFIFQHPGQASDLVHQILHTLGSWAQALINFVQGVFQ